MIRDGDYDKNVDMDDIIYLISGWDEEYCIDDPQELHMREYYAIKSQGQDPDNALYTEELSSEYQD